MSSPLRLSPGLALPLDAVTRTFGIVGQRGTGKSTAAAVLVEEIAAAGARAVIVDPTGVWWGLASSADGKGPGVEAIVLGGEHADAPLEETGGHLVAELVAEAAYSVVVLDLKLMRKAQQVRFLADFAEVLYHRNREALHVVWDEAGRFAPQQLRESGMAPRLLGAIEDHVKLGRSRGLGCTLIEQRPATINKNVLSQIETLVAFRLIGPQDRKAIHDWVEAQGDPEREREVMETIAKLKRGEAWVWSPSWLDFLGRVEFRAAHTFDSRRTPEVGVRVKAPSARAPVDLDALREQMAETIERAAESDPKELRRRLAAAEQRAAEAEARPAPDPVREIVEVPVLDEARAEALQEALVDASQRFDDALAKVSADHVEALRSIWAEVEQLRRAIPEPQSAPVAPQAPALSPRRRRQNPLPTAAQPRQRPDSDPDGDGPGLRSGERALLAALAAYPEPLSPPRWGALAALHGSGGFAPRGGTYRTYVGTLKRHSLVSLNGSGRASITAEGLAHLDANGGRPEVRRPGAGLREAWLGLLRSGEREMMVALLDAHPGGLAREELAEQSGFAAGGGTFRTYLGKLKRWELVEASGDQFRAADFLVDGVRA